MQYNDAHLSNSNEEATALEAEPHPGFPKAVYRMFLTDSGGAALLHLDKAAARELRDELTAWIEAP